MKVTECSNISISNGCYTATPRCKVSKPRKFDKLPEQDYGRNYMQLSYIIGMSMLGLASLFFATKGKTGLNIRV